MSYAVPARLAHLRVDGAQPVVYVAPLPDGPPVVLQGSAARIWLAATDPDTGTTAAAVAAGVAAAVGTKPEQITADVDAFLTELVNAGLLEVRP
ncbi:PqqD family peptide modification chaperone [Actinomyces sp. MRS3W]|uniref:PqqD family peptide modification chaperone n=1 Tax=Actinomyces sp. MRS3W TaxID=2800796 RepID=UPI0028FD0818|nr:PqqD family peptide modification chaperone [Actinomyces sp. MRS3W]MDU0348878.1 PqqD family peptide modification chaperone [Actinomyces sp. MRS3W]